MTSEDCEDSGDRHGGPGLEARGRVTNRDAVKILLSVLQKRREISSEKRKYVDTIPRLYHEEEECVRVAVHHVRAGVEARGNACFVVALYKMSCDLLFTRNGLNIAVKCRQFYDKSNVYFLASLLGLVCL